MNHSHRGEELQLLIPSGQMTQAVEELRPITCLCIIDRRGSAAPRSWRNSGRRSGLATRPPSFSVLPRLPQEPTHHSALTPLASFASECTKEAPWTSLTLNMQDIFSFIRKDLSIVTQQDAVAKHQHNRFIIFCDEDIPPQLFGDTCYTEGGRTSIEDAGWQITDNNTFSDVKNWPQDPNNNNDQHEPVSRDSLNTRSLRGLLKSCQICDAAGVLSGRDKRVKKRKSVSFDDDVTVYLFDQVLSSCCLLHCSLVGLGLCFPLRI